MNQARVRVLAVDETVTYQKIVSSSLAGVSGVTVVGAAAGGKIGNDRRDCAAVIGLGISTGGPQSLIKMLPQLPGDFPVPILIVQHMPPVFTASLAEDLDRRCALTVREAISGQSISPGHVLIAPGGRQMKVVSNGGPPRIRVTDDPPENSCQPSVDYLFRSLASVYGRGAAGVIMTGMGEDGASGCREIKQRGGKIVAQDEASCIVFGMPQKPIEEGIADVVAPLDRIAAEILRLVGRNIHAYG